MTEVDCVKGQGTPSSSPRLEHIHKLNLSPAIKISDSKIIPRGQNMCVLFLMDNAPGVLLIRPENNTTSPPLERGHSSTAHINQNYTYVTTLRLYRPCTYVLATKAHLRNKSGRFGVGKRDKMNGRKKIHCGADVIIPRN